jgi:hypothetical protein
MTDDSMTLLYKAEKLSIVVARIRKTDFVLELFLILSLRERVRGGSYWAHNLSSTKCSQTCTVSNVLYSNL